MPIATRHHTYNPLLRVIASHPTGSNYICDPPVEDTDIDTLLLVNDLDIAREQFLRDGWEESQKGILQQIWGYIDPLQNIDQYDIEPGYGSFWLSFKRGKENYIVTSNRAFYITWIAATLLCKEMNLTDKADRVKLHRLIKDASRYYDGPVIGQH